MAVARGSDGHQGDSCRRAIAALRFVSVLQYVGPWPSTHRTLLMRKRHVIGRLLHFPGSALPRRGHIELAREWGWPRLPSEASVAVSARTRSERTGTAWEDMESVPIGALASRPLAYLA